MRTLQCVLLASCFMLLGSLAGRAQTSASGDVFAGQDPLSVSKVVMPQASTGECLPPRNSNWRLLAQQDGTCYYVAPFPQPINGYVTSIDNVGALQKFGVRCGVDEFNASEVVCQNPRDGLPGASPTTGPPAGFDRTAPKDPTASTGNLNRQPAPSASDPCHPNYNMSTAAGRAAAQQNAAQTKRACDEERCKYNPQLEVCGGPPDPPPPGIKGVGRDSGPTPPPATPLPPPARPLKAQAAPPSFRVAALAMSNCLRARLPDFPIMLLQARYMQMANYSASDSPQSVAVSPARKQILLEEIAMAAQVQDYHDQRYGPPKNGTDGAKEFLAGWFDRCLQSAGLESSADSRPAYANFLGVPITDPRVLTFGSGYLYGDVAAPWSLIPPAGTQ